MSGRRCNRPHQAVALPVLITQLARWGDAVDRLPTNKYLHDCTCQSSLTRTALSQVRSSLAL
jgi:hypothetical protein